MGNKGGLLGFWIEVVIELLPFVLAVTAAVEFPRLNGAASKGAAARKNGLKRKPPAVKRLRCPLLTRKKAIKGVMQVIKMPLTIRLSGSSVVLCGLLAVLDCRFPRPDCAIERNVPIIALCGGACQVLPSVTASFRR